MDDRTRIDATQNPQNVSGSVTPQGSSAAPVFQAPSASPEQTLPQQPIQQVGSPSQVPQQQPVYPQSIASQSPQTTVQSQSFVAQTPMSSQEQPVSSTATPPGQAPQSAPSVAENTPSEPTPSRHIPDLTSPQQVMTPLTENVVPPKPSQSETPPPPPQKPSSSAKKGFGLPKPLIFSLVGFLVLLVLFIGLKVLGSMTGGGSSGKVTLTYWGLWEDSNVMQGVISDFERQHPDITVNYSKEDPHEYSKTVLTRIQNGNGPDIFRYHVSWLPMMLPSLLPLSTDAISKSDFAKSYYPVIQQDLIQNGAIYGIPLEIDTLALFVNKKMLSDNKIEVPTTWDAYITAARQLTQKDANGKIQVAGAAMGTYDNITHASDIISLLLVQNGVDLATMTPASNASDALTFYNAFAKDQNNVWDNTLDPSLLAFERGKLAMYIGYSWDVFAIQGANPNLDFGIYPVPHLPGRNTTIASYWVEGISSRTAHPKEAMEFMHFLAQKDTATKLYTAEAKTRPFGEPYARVDLADSLKNTPLVYPFVSQAANASSTYFAADTQDTGITAQMNGYLANAVNAILGNTSADTAVDTLSKGVSQVLNQYGQQ